MTALELAALALASLAMGESRSTRARPRATAKPEAPESDDDIGIVVETVVVTPSTEPLSFLTDVGDEDTRYYRALDDRGSAVLVAFYIDGRVRLANDEHRLAGIVQSGHADLLDVANNTWSELFVRETPEGRIQLELRGGPYDTRILTCEVLR